jgi:hypothetical protein
MQEQNVARRLLLMCREDIYPFSFCYDAEPTSEAVYTRSVLPHVQRVLDGFNVNCLLLGSISSKKDVLFQGHGGTTQSGGSVLGIVHHALSSLFDTLHKRSVEVCVVYGRQK